jgi:hypothetical protein
MYAREYALLKAMVHMAHGIYCTVLECTALLDDYGLFQDYQSSEISEPVCWSWKYLSKCAVLD